MQIKENALLRNLLRIKTIRSVLIAGAVCVFVFFFLFPFSVNAQCAMCRAAIESEGSSGKAEAINDGIVYLMVIPYLLIGAIAYAIYRMRKPKKG